MAGAPLVAQGISAHTLSAHGLPHSNGHPYGYTRERTASEIASERLLPTGVIGDASSEGSLSERTDGSSPINGVQVDGTAPEGPFSVVPLSPVSIPTNPS